MRKFLLFLILVFCFCGGACQAEDYTGLRDYSAIEIPKGTFIQAMSAQEISTVYCDVGTKVKFISTADLYLVETNVIPKNSEFFGYVEKINEPVIGTNASMIIKIVKLKLPDGFELPMKAYVSAGSGILIGGEQTAPATYDKKPSYRQGYKSMVGYVPGAQRRMGEPKIIASGADLIIVLAGPLWITHTVTN